MLVPVYRDISYDTEKDNFIKKVDYLSFAKYLRGIFSNIEKADQHFFNPLKQYLRMLEYKNIAIINLVRQYYIETTPFTYKQAFEIKDAEFRALVFGSINVVEMIKNLGSKRINVEGKTLNLRVYREDGTYTMQENNNIYELYEIDCTQLEVQNNFAVKCWCTSTNKEHWLWIEPEYAKRGALEAIASTMRVYENMIPHIKTIKRQGDVLLFEMTKTIKPEGNIVPLTADQYFGLLVSQS